jgi:1-acyl-sn-glycerol-3-phosphate acyltransferase
MTQSRPDPEAVHGSLFFSMWVLVVLIVALPPLWLLLTLSPAGDRADRLVRTSARRLVRWSGCGLNVIGTEHLADTPCALMVANHSSFLDSVVLLAAVPGDFRFVVNHLAATRPLVGLAIHKAGHLVVNRGSARSRATCGRAMIAALRAGRSLMVFPEGTRGGRELLPFQTGPFRIAAFVGCSVTPVAIVGTRSILPRRFRLLRRTPITVIVLPAIAAAAPEHCIATDLRDRAARALSECLAAQA